MCNIVLQLADIDTRTSWRCSVQEITAQVLPQSTGASYGIRRDAVFFIFVWVHFRPMIKIEVDKQIAHGFFETLRC